MNELDEIWAEIDAIYRLPERQPEDIDSSQMKERYGGSLGTAQRRMHKFVDSGKYEFLTVRDINRLSGKCLVIRKISTT